jgi:ribosomal protein S18 acetylase RimI-like enzyme
MKFRFIKTEDPEYSKELMLRWEEIQKPLGLPPGSEYLPEENKSLHLLAMDGKKVVGCVLFCPENERRGRIFHMVMSEEYQGRGFSRRIINFLEQSLFRLGFREIYLHAMPDSISFYERMGFMPEEEIIEKMGIPHRTMKKVI